MTFADLRQRAQYLATMDGNEDAYPNPDWGSLVNAGYRDFVWDAETQTIALSITTVTNQREYPMLTGGQDIKFVKDCILGTGTRLYPTTEERLRETYPLWAVDPNGQPMWFWTDNPNTLALYPTPASGGDTLTIRAIGEPPQLVNDTDVPLIPGRYHEAIACRAAWLHASQYVKGQAPDADKMRVDAYDATFRQMVKDCKSWSASDDSQPQRRVAARPAERVPMGLWPSRWWRRTA